jgi:sec-independent protein translocase protein TatA
MHRTREEEASMFGLSHLPEILILLVLALLVFGPKKMIEMGSSVGRMFRELRDATREMNWSNILGEHEERPSQSSYTQSTVSPDFEAEAIRAAAERAAERARAATTASNPTIVESTIVHPEQPTEPPAE